MNEYNSNDSAMDIIAQYIAEMKTAQGADFSYDKVNLAELERRTGLSRQRLRTLQKHEFKDVPHGNNGKTATSSILDGYTDSLDMLLRSGVTNSSVLLERLQDQGYEGSQTTVKRYVQKHKDLVPAKRQLVAPQGNRGKRYQTDPGEAYQMDWGFVTVTDHNGDEYRAACFAMICHHCGFRYVEFFPNAKQENLFIGMLHAFFYMGVPLYVLTDNMKSVVLKLDVEGHPIWQKDYENFMKTIGFHTRLCKPRHPFTKGKVERLIRFVKDNFLAGRTFWTVTDLNIEALRWCEKQNHIYQRAIGDIPFELHCSACSRVAYMLEESEALLPYLCPERKISFDGFVNYEGRRFGVPFRYKERTARVRRKGFYIYIYSSDFKDLLVTHEVTWSRRDRFCSDQYVLEQPEEHPTAAITTKIVQLPELPDNAFDKFDFDKEDPS